MDFYNGDIQTCVKGAQGAVTKRASITAPQQLYINYIYCQMFSCSLSEAAENRLISGMFKGHILAFVHISLVCPPLVTSAKEKSAFS